MTRDCFHFIVFFFCHFFARLISKHKNLKIIHDLLSRHERKTVLNHLVNIINDIKHNKKTESINGKIMQKRTLLTQPLHLLNKVPMRGCVILLRLNALSID